VRILRWAGRFWTGVLVVIVALAGLLIGLRLVLPIFDSPPALLNASPADGANSIAPRTRVTLHFDRPMNPRSVVRALQLSPPAAWAPIWSDDGATLTISPTEALQPETAYVLTLSEQALSRRFRALAAPIELHFRTAQAPEVVVALPADNAGDVALDSPMSIRFSRAIVPASALMQVTELPELQFDPPVAGSAVWLDSATVLFRPAKPLRAGTRYRATLAATLADANGGQLSKPFTWSFGTPAPQVLAIAPADRARLVAPRATLTLTVSQPLALESLRASLTFSPTISGQLAAADLPDGGQLITFQPDAELLPETTYTATLQAGVAPIEGNLPLLKPVMWSFTTAPRPALTGRFPGEGQTLPNGQEIRLVFNTAIDSDAFRESLQLTPPAEALRVTSSDSEIRISADLHAATVYTMTLPATLTDRNGIPLGQEYRIRFLTAPSGPTLELPEVAGHIAQLVPGRTAGLLVRRTNLSALNADLYQLDEAAIVRTLGFQESDWSAFQPERYSQPLLRSWRIPPSDQLNTAVEERIRLALDPDRLLPAGAYYLRLRSLEGPRADVLLLVARTRLTLQTSGIDALIWATDIISGTPVAGLPVALYRAGALAHQGVTDPGGSLRFTGLSRSGAAYIAIAGGRLFGAGSAAGIAGRQASDQRNIFVTTDHATYRPGETVQFAGIVRATTAPSGTLALPPNEPIGVNIRRNASTARLYQATLRLSATGVFSAAVPLAADTPTGQYTLTASVDGVAHQIGFTVQPAVAAPLQITVGTPQPLLAGETVPVSVTVHTLEGLPVAGATISWTLDAERAPFSAADGVVFGDDEHSPTPIAERSGTAQTDANGQLSLSIANLPADDVPLRYRLVAWAAEPGGASAAGSGTFIVAPARRMAGVRLPSRIFTVGKTGAVDLLALTVDGQPAPHTTVRVEVYRRTWERATATDLGATTPTDLTPKDRLALTRSIATGDDGTAKLPLTLTAGGVYRLRVSAADDSGQPVYSSITAWATAPGFTDWGDLPGDQPLLIADRPAYHPGETATLLVTTSLARSNALIARSGVTGFSSEVRALRAGTTFTLTIQPDDPPEVPISVLLAGRVPDAGATIASPPALPIARSVLPVVSDRQALGVNITTDRISYAPGATALFTITTSANGAGIPADIIVSLSSAASAPESRIADALGPAAFSAIASPATLIASVGAPTAQVPQLPLLPPGVTSFRSPAQRTNSSGVLTLTVQLPRAPLDLRATAWAASVDRFGQAQSTLAITQPIGLRVVAPPLFRVGDQVELAAYVQNAGPSGQTVELNLAVAGLEIQPGSSPTQHVRMAPGTTTRLAWQARVLDTANAHVSMSASSGAGAPQVVQLEHPIMPATPDRPPSDGGIALLREYLDPLTGELLDPARLRAGQLVHARLTVVSMAAHGALTIEEALPASALLLETGPDDATRIEHADGRLTLETRVIVPGIKQYNYFLRLVAGGRYGVPAPTARAADGASGVGNVISIDVAGR